MAALSDALDAHTAEDQRHAEAVTIWQIKYSHMDAYSHLVCLIER